LSVKYNLKISKLSVSFGLFILLLPLKSDANFQNDSLNRVTTGIKINPLLFFRGELPIYLEQKITGNLSIEGAYLWTKNDVFAGAFDHDLGAQSGITEVETGNGYKLAIRWYFRNNLELSGTYISAEYGEREFMTNYFQRDTLGIPTSERILDRRNFREIKLIGGIQRLGYYSNFFLDFHGGVGYKFKDFQEVHLEPDMSAQPSHFLIFNKSEGIAFYLGFKIGFGF